MTVIHGANITLSPLSSLAQPPRPLAGDELRNLYSLPLSPEEDLLKADVIWAIKPEIEKRHNALLEGCVLPFIIKPYIRPGLVQAIDLDLGSEWYLFESRKGGIPADPTGFMQYPESSDLRLIRLPSAISIVGSSLRDFIQRNSDSLLAGKFLSFNPGMEVGIELASHLNNALGSDFALNEISLPSGEIGYVILAVTNEDERAVRARFLPMTSAWTTAKGL